ncbi:hypothetical protein TURU_092448 [Turdus rufiventris]|nr:hypothetical protein TURU_092448 [Turdus rufiventris]
MDRELFQWENDVSSSTGEKPVGPVKEGDTQTCSPEGPSSASPVGTEVAAETAHAPTSALLSPQSPKESELAAPVLPGAVEEAPAGSVLAEQERTDHSTEEMKLWQYLDDLEPFMERDPEQSQKLSDHEECMDDDVSPGEVSSFHNPSDWEEHFETGLSQGDVITCTELSDWEDPICQTVSGGDGSRPLGYSSWEDDSSQELGQENWADKTKPSIGTKPFHPEDDEWNELPSEDQAPKQKGFAADKLPAPREAWAERPALEPCSTPGKRHSLFRQALRALRGLLYCPCLRPQPQE